MTENATIARVVEAPVEIPPGWVMDAKGRMVPKHMVKDHELLEDQVVRTVIGHAEALSAQIARFKGHTFEDVATLLDILAEKYGARKRGVDGKGNVTLTTYDGTLQVQVQVQDQMTFGSTLQTAKTLIDDCLRAWSADARPELRAVVTEAFRTDKEGQVSREAMFSLLRMEIDDAGWVRAMQALRDSIRVVGSKAYIRLRRKDPQRGWVPISVDLASAVVPEGMTASHIPAPPAPPAGATPEGGA